MQIFVRQLDGSNQVTEVTDFSVAAVNMAVGLDEQTNYLSIGGVPLESADQLSENCTVELLARLPGGIWN